MRRRPRVSSRAAPDPSSSVRSEAMIALRVGRGSVGLPGVTGVETTSGGPGGEGSGSGGCVRAGRAGRAGRGAGGAGAGGRALEQSELRDGLEGLGARRFELLTFGGGRAVQ